MSQPSSTSDGTHPAEAKQAIDFISRAVEKGLTRLIALDVVNNTELFAEIDRVIEQAVTISRQGLLVHAVGARFDTQVLFLVDQDPQFDWLLPAVRKRLADAASSVKVEIDTSVAFLGDLAGTQALRFMGFELRTVPDKHGLRLKYQRLDESGSPQEDPAAPAPQARPKRLKSKRTEKSDSSEDEIERSPQPAQPKPAQHWQWTLPDLGFARWALGSVSAIGRYAKRHWLKGAVGTAAIAGLVVLLFLLFRTSMRELPAPHMPAGFYQGEYRATPTAEPVRYGLYLPPHFSKERGPFPLVVFFHGYPERGPDRYLAIGLPQSIVFRFGEETPNGRFEFAAFFPIDPEGMWLLKPKEFDGIVAAIDDVVARHNIDPKRLYLTGHSNGATGVRALAHARPDKWAALAPASSFALPDLESVRRTPIWIFHGEKDPLSPVEQTRAVVQKLKEANVDVRYTESQGKAHVIWREVYDHKTLYDWFATKRRP